MKRDSVKIDPLQPELVNIDAFYNSLEYPDSAKTAGVAGQVLTWLIVGEDGRAKCARVIEGLGYGLDEAVLRAIENAQFKPVRLFDKTYVSPLVLPVQIKLPTR